MKKPRKIFIFEKTKDEAFSVKEFETLFDPESVLKAWMNGKLIRWLASLPDQDVAARVRKVSVSQTTPTTAEAQLLLEAIWNNNVPESIKKHLQDYVEAERKARVEAERKARVEAERKARVEAERKVHAEAKCLAKVEAERKALEKIHLPGDVILEMVPIKAGSFMMGSPETETGRRGDETRHRVTLTKDYWLGKYPVTQAQWTALMENNPSTFHGANHPVEKVSWNDAMAFCEKLNERYAGKLPNGYNFGLPTEAQWEYACRAGTATAYFWGNALNGDRANCNGDQPCGTNFKGSYLGETTVVDKYSPNAWGLYDMHGNVCEWCRDIFSYYVPDATDPVGHENGSIRVIRGGSWNYDAKGCRSAYRNYFGPGYQCSCLGFRLALVPVQ